MEDWRNCVNSGGLCCACSVLSDCNGEEVSVKAGEAGKMVSVPILLFSFRATQEYDSRQGGGKQAEGRGLGNGDACVGD